MLEVFTGVLGGFDTIEDTNRSNRSNRSCTQEILKASCIEPTGKIVTRIGEGWAKAVSLFGP